MLAQIQGKPSPEPVAPERTPAKEILVAGPSAETPADIPALGSGTAKERIIALLETSPDVTAGEASRLLGTDPSYTRKVLRELRPKQAVESPAEHKADSSQDVEEQPAEAF